MFIIPVPHGNVFSIREKYVKYFTAAYVYHLELECGTTHYSNKPRGMPPPKARIEESKTRESFIARKTNRAFRAYEF